MRLRRGLPLRALTLSVGLSLMAVGLLGALASEFETRQQPTPLADALRGPVGSRVFVRGLLEHVRPVAGGAAVSSISDCAGTRVAVFFAGGAPTDLAYRLVTLDAVVAEYRGARELAVASPERATATGEGAALTTPDELREHWRAMRCHEVGLTGTIAWARLKEGDARTAELGLRTNGSDLYVFLHSQSFIELKVKLEISATLVGVVGASEDGLEGVLHVRI